MTSEQRRRAKKLLSHFPRDDDPLPVEFDEPEPLEVLFDIVDCAGPGGPPIASGETYRLTHDERGRFGVESIGEADE